MWINLWITTKKVYNCIMQSMNTQKPDTANARYLKISASKEGVVHNRSFFVILTTDSFEALFISYFKPAGIW